MFVPLWDMNPVRRIRFQWVTLGLILANCAVYFLLQMGLLYPVSTEALVAFAVVPAELVHQGFLNQPVVHPVAGALRIPEGLTLLTYMFLHGNILHLAGNMIFLWVFGDNVEDAMGHVRFLFFYLICGIFAGLTHALVSNNSDVPMIGASGAVAGVIAAYLMLHPNVRVWVLAFFRIPLRVSAGFALIFWIVLQIISVIFDDGSGTAWWAHIGGLIAGAVLVLFMRAPGVQLFNRATGLEPGEAPSGRGAERA
ncbi:MULTISPECIES: rhomboid family intramembrane serine protease [Rhodomicrobium]|uniref:rhomboid family intramembrane serine protease n=1 Tax=Rhodomicrobium TaxID=1068 RepID=UPI000B4BEF9B|nr:MULTISPECIES: rhomboid family intramembrane serine protease [Rhodomicrobium]